MLRIEKGTHFPHFLVSNSLVGLHELHRENRDAEKQQDIPATIQPSPPTTQAPQLIPFAIVNSVAPSSPAAEAVPHSESSPL
jgi:hypothetical protein